MIQEAWEAKELERFLQREKHTSYFHAACPVCGLLVGIYAGHIALHGEATEVCDGSWKKIRILKVEEET